MKHLENEKMLIQKLKEYNKKRKFTQKMNEYESNYSKIKQKYNLRNTPSSFEIVM